MNRPLVEGLGWDVPHDRVQGDRRGGVRGLVHDRVPEDEHRALRVRLRREDVARARAYGPTLAPHHARVRQPRRLSERLHLRGRGHRERVHHRRLDDVDETP